MLDTTGRWNRVDPTVSAANRDEKSLDPASDFDGRAKTIAGWSAQWDRIRMLWYRHIVNFDQQDQVDLVKTFRGKTDTSVRRARLWVEWLRAVLLRLLRGPWD